MAVAAIDAVIADVMFVTELDGLLNLNPLAGVPGRTADFGKNPQRCYQNKDGSEDRRLRQTVRAVMKNLGHRRSLANTYAE